MPQLFIDKTNKMPIYLQLKDQIRYYISTGAFAAEEQMPPIKVLASDLGINFQTVRKAYIELERDGLIQVRHGEGTFISFNHRPMTPQDPGSEFSRREPRDSTARLRLEMDKLLTEYHEEGVSLTDIETTTVEAVAELSRRCQIPNVIFAECNHFQITEISKLLEDELGIPVNPVLVNKLNTSLPDLINDSRNTTVVTTGFHVTEVRDAIGDLPVEVEVLITNLNPATRRQLELVGENARFSFICRDRESAVLYKDLLKAELGFADLDLTTCTIYETAKVNTALNSSDIVLASPPVYDQVREMAPNRKAVYNVFERVDPMSLSVLKRRILSQR